MSFIVKNLIKNGFDVKDAFQDYLYDWNDNEGRFEFIGDIAEGAIRDKYKLQSVKHYFKKGNMAPFMYLNC